MANEPSELDELSRLLGRRLAGIRQEVGLTQSQLAVPLLDTTSVVQNGYVVQTFTRGTGPLKQTFWTGYWSAAGS